MLCTPFGLILTGFFNRMAIKSKQLEKRKPDYPGKSRKGAKMPKKINTNKEKMAKQTCKETFSLRWFCLLVVFIWHLVGRFWLSFARVPLFLRVYFKHAFLRRYFCFKWNILTIFERTLIILLKITWALGVPWIPMIAVKHIMRLVTLCCWRRTFAGCVEWCGNLEMVKKRVQVSSSTWFSTLDRFTGKHIPADILFFPARCARWIKLVQFQKLLKPVKCAKTEVGGCLGQSAPPEVCT